MGVHDHGRLSETGPQDHVGRLPPDTWERHERVHGVRHLPAELLGQHAAAGDEISRLAFVESGRPYDRLELSGIGSSVIHCPAVSAEALRRDVIYPLIGGLS